MKDATGELSMTAVAVVAIAAIGVVFSQLVWPAIKRNIERSAHCTESDGCTCAGNGGVGQCFYLDENDATQKIQCPEDK